MDNVVKFKKLAENFTLLYVEDEEKLRNSISKYLSKFFKLVDEAEDGQHGLEKYSKNKYDLVLTDISMPKLNGIEMCREIKTINPHQEIVILSAYSESSLLLDAIKIGIDGYIIKPVNLHQMNEILYKIVYKMKEFKENEVFKFHLQELVDEKSKDIEILNNDKILNYKSTLYAMVEMIEQRDTYTGGHSQRVANYSKLMAESMGYNEDESNEIYEAGMLHDIGKIAIPDSILLKPGNLNDIEYKLIQEHVDIGYKILEKIPIFSNIATIIKAHHERLDGSGYPLGIQGENIPSGARIMAVADAFDAMTTQRIYKEKKTQKEALQVISDAKGTLFCEDAVKAALRVLGDVQIDHNITQVPISNLETERFSYFYKDQLTQAYNSNYLDLILAKNNYEHLFDTVNLIFLKNFGAYNSEHGWKRGDEMLKLTAAKLQNLYPNALTFRIHGDDFAVLRKSAIDINTVQEFMKSIDLAHSCQKISLKDSNIDSLESLEKYLTTQRHVYF